MSPVTLKLKDYQRAGLAFLRKSNGRAILADDTGTGKTPQAIAYLNETQPNRVLVIAPVNVIYQWLDSLNRWTDYKSTIYFSNDPLGTLARHSIDLFTWDSFQKRLDDLAYRRYSLLIVDEAHRAKDYHAQRTQALTALARTVPQRILLTATPIPNRREELFPLLNIVDPLAWSSPYRFKHTYCNDNKQAASWRVKNYADLRRHQQAAADDNYHRLSEAIKPWFLRRLKSEVLPELGQPTLVRYPVYGGDSRHMPAYLEAETDLIEYLRSRGLPTTGAERAPQLVKLGRLRQLLGQIKAEMVLEKALDILADPDKQVVLYAIHKEVVAELEDGLIEAEVSFGVIDGRASAAKRQDIRNAFLSRRLRAIVLSSAGEEGLDLYSAQDILFAERPWTADAEAQAIGRLHRTGQGGRVTAHIPLVLGTIDRRLDAIIEGKRALKRGTIGADDYQTVTRELFQSLLASGKEAVM